MSVMTHLNALDFIAAIIASLFLSLRYKTHLMMMMMW